MVHPPINGTTAKKLAWLTGVFLTLVSSALVLCGTQIARNTIRLTVLETQFIEMRGLLLRIDTNVEKNAGILERMVGAAHYPDGTPIRR